MCEHKGLLFYELLSRLRRIAKEFGEDAAWIELALQGAIQDEKMEWEQDQQEQAEMHRA